MLITETHKDNIQGCLHCYDRVIINATAGTFGYAGGMSSFFYQKGYKIFDFAKIFTPVTENIKANAESIAKENGLTIEYIRKSGAFRKDDKIAQILEQRGSHEGLIHIFSALELCDTYSPWHDKSSGKTFFKNDRTKCLHYYFYFMDKDLGLCFLRVPTIAPFKLIFYFNGHNLLENKLKKAEIEYQKVDNAFVSISKPDDLIQSCYFAMLRAVKDYNPDKPYLFNSYLNSHVNNVCREVLGLRGKKRIANVISLNEPLTQDDSSEIIDTVCDPLSERPYDDIDDSDFNRALGKILRECIGELGELQRDILCMRYWDMLTLKECGERLNISPERVRSIANNALRNLRKYPHKNKLMPYAEYYSSGLRYTGLSSFNIRWASSVELAFERMEREG